MQTLSDILDEIEQARQIAIDERKPTAMLQATLAKAKLLGVDKCEPEQSSYQQPIFNIVGVSPDEAKREFEQVARQVLAMV